MIKPTRKPSVTECAEVGALLFALVAKLRDDLTVTVTVPMSVAAPQTPPPTVVVREPSRRLAWTIRQFCEAAGISRATFYNLADEGRTPPTFKIGERAVRIRDDDVQTWLAAQK